ncbi:hypothetical protein [Hydrogenivirga sp. 128-5-R1-1]|uniref:hypothetical protein n=1 Tax=Hydrogenivirga sp. 128-5-R1-1 TaxID=392423 RepID=UPI00015F17F7|nr:hypothetical protein [Hydrogenivirga sp. 128-5-R1-1]EDP76080.1 hypothetical protein HG1285_17959 [Hydrogenivirga sp. 128-5-R1-1]
MIHEHQIEKLKGRFFTEEELKREVKLHSLVRDIRKEIEEAVREHFSKTDQEFNHLQQVSDNYGILVRVVRDKDTGRLYYFYYFKHRIPYREYYFYKEEEEE